MSITIWRTLDYMRIFFSGPLTNLKNPEETKKFYLKMADAATSCGYTYYWAFLRKRDHELSPGEVYTLHTGELRKSDLVIAYIGEPSFGAGIEVEHAGIHHIPVYLLFHQNAKISAMLLGNPAVTASITYENEEDCLMKLTEFLRIHQRAGVHNPVA